MESPRIVFVGGGHMAAALVGGLVKAGRPPTSIAVVDPSQEARAQLHLQHGVTALAQADGSLAGAAMAVWAVKPQSFDEAAAAAAPHLRDALHLSVMAGVRTDAIARRAGTERVVRAMPNMPAFIGQGISGLFARAAVNAGDRAAAEAAMASVGEVCWVDAEAQLDAVTALSGSGPAYVFHLLEALIDAGTGLGLDAEQSRRLAVATVEGAAALARQSGEAPSALREKVTSKGGTTHAALAVLDAAGVHGAYLRALQAAAQRARELGDAQG